MKPCEDCKTNYKVCRTCILYGLNLYDEPRKEFDEIINEYSNYCKNDGRKHTHLPFAIWVKLKKGEK